MTQTARTPWTQANKDQWFQAQKIQRSYKDDVLSKIAELKSIYEIQQYGALSINPEKYPLFLMKTKNFDPKKKTVIITGGVHGYETSGVHGALAFMKNEVKNYPQFNFVCVPCISPWSYETINRWNPKAIDPNRSFRAESPSEECALFLKAVEPYMKEIYAHFDLHETTDTDNTVFRPALAARDGKPEPKEEEIPDGFYTVGDTGNPTPEFQRAIIEAVKKVTHIAPADKDGNIIGDPMVQEGVINYDMKKLFLCGGFSNAKFMTTTEVYPDSPKVTDEICVVAQVAAVKGGLDYIASL